MLTLEAQTDAYKIKLEDVIASVRTNTNSLATFEEQLANFHCGRQQFAKELLVILADTNSSDLSQCAAAYYLGEMRFPEAAEVLAGKIAFRFNALKYPWYNFPNVSDYPALDALVKIGNPSISAVIRNLAESDDAKVGELSLQVLNRIEGDKDIVRLRLQKALDTQKNSVKRARLQVALDALAATQFDK
jgi:hypothetical protein